jgi:type VI secretion system secreted protein VgrG
MQLVTALQAYNSAYDQFESDGDEAAARRSIGQTFGAGEISSVQVDGKYVNYNEYYGSSWREP